VGAVSLKLALAKSSTKFITKSSCVLLVRRGHANTFWARSRILSQSLLGLVHLPLLQVLRLVEYVITFVHIL
jgi:hypothetical protein